MNANEGSTVELSEDALQVVAVGGSFDLTVTTEHGPFVVGNTHDRDDAQELVDMVSIDLFGNWKQNGLTHVAADTVAAGLKAAEGHRTFKRMAGV